MARDALLVVLANVALLVLALAWTSPSLSANGNARATPQCAAAEHRHDTAADAAAAAGGSSAARRVCFLLHTRTRVGVQTHVPRFMRSAEQFVLLAERAERRAALHFVLLTDAALAVDAAHLPTDRVTRLSAARPHTAAADNGAAVAADDADAASDPLAFREWAEAAPHYAPQCDVALWADPRAVFTQSVGADAMHIALVGAGTALSVAASRPLLPAEGADSGGARVHVFGGAARAFVEAVHALDADVTGDGRAFAHTRATVAGAPHRSADWYIARFVQRAGPMRVAEWSRDAVSQAISTSARDVTAALSLGPMRTAPFGQLLAPASGTAEPAPTPSATPTAKRNAVAVIVSHPTIPLPQRVEAARVLLHSLLHTGVTRADVVALVSRHDADAYPAVVSQLSRVTGDLPSHRTHTNAVAAAAVGMGDAPANARPHGHGRVRVVTVDPICGDEHTRGRERPEEHGHSAGTSHATASAHEHDAMRGSAQWWTLALWSLTQYHRVLHLSADSLVTGPLDAPFADDDATDAASSSSSSSSFSASPRARAGVPSEGLWLRAAKQFCAPSEYGARPTPVWALPPDAHGTDTARDCSWDAFDPGVMVLQPSTAVAAYLKSLVCAADADADSSADDDTAARAALQRQRSAWPPRTEQHFLNAVFSNYQRLSPHSNALPVGVVAPHFQRTRPNLVGATLATDPQRVRILRWTHCQPPVTDAAADTDVACAMASADDMRWANALWRAERAALRVHDAAPR